MRRVARSVPTSCGPFAWSAAGAPSPDQAAQRFRYASAVESCRPGRRSNSRAEPYGRCAAVSPPRIAPRCSPRTRWPPPTLAPARGNRGHRQRRRQRTVRSTVDSITARPIHNQTTMVPHAGDQRGPACSRIRCPMNEHSGGPVPTSCIRIAVPLRSRSSCRSVGATPTDSHNRVSASRYRCSWELFCAVVMTTSFGRHVRETTSGPRCRRTTTRQRWR